MPEETLQALSSQELAEIDAQYEPFPSFSEWPHDVPASEAWQRSRDEFQAAADQATDEVLLRAQEIARRIAAFDTGAIEGLYATNRGLTFTVAEQAAAWEQKVDAQGADARALFEAQLRAFELVLDHVTDRFPKVTQAWLRRLHEEITAPQKTYIVHTPIGVQEQPLPKGEYKKFPNHVRMADGGVHAYAPVDSTQSEMQRLVKELEATAFQHSHPIIQASYAHYALVAIHPFADGNGRLARAAASSYTYRDASIPLLVLDEHRDQYFAALAKADAGDAGSFVGFIARVTHEALDLVRDSLQTAKAPQPMELLDKFTSLYKAEELRKRHDQLARQFVDWLVGAVEKQVSRLDAPAGVRLGVEAFDDSRNDPPAGWRQIDLNGSRSFRINFNAAPPASAETVRRVDIFVSAEPDRIQKILLKGVQTPDEQITLDRFELEPSLSSLAERRIENFVQRVLGDGLEALLEEARSRLGQ